MDHDEFDEDQLVVIETGECLMDGGGHLMEHDEVDDGCSSEGNTVTLAPADIPLSPHSMILTSAQPSSVIVHHSDQDSLSSGGFGVAGGPTLAELASGRRRLHQGIIRQNRLELEEEDEDVFQQHVQQQQQQAQPVSTITSNPSQESMMLPSVANLVVGTASASVSSTAGTSMSAATAPKLFMTLPTLATTGAASSGGSVFILLLQNGPDGTQNILIPGTAATAVPGTGNSITAAGLRLTSASAVSSSGTGQLCGSSLLCTSALPVTNSRLTVSGATAPLLGSASSLASLLAKAAQAGTPTSGSISFAGDGGTLLAAPAIGEQGQLSAVCSLAATSTLPLSAAAPAGTRSNQTTTAAATVSTNNSAVISVLPIDPSVVEEEEEEDEAERQSSCRADQSVRSTDSLDCASAAAVTCRPSTKRCNQSNLSTCRSVAPDSHTDSSIHSTAQEQVQLLLNSTSAGATDGAEEAQVVSEEDEDDSCTGPDSVGLVVSDHNSLLPSEQIVHEINAAANRADSPVS